MAIKLTQPRYSFSDAHLNVVLLDYRRKINEIIDEVSLPIGTGNTITIDNHYITEEIIDLDSFTVGSILFVGADKSISEDPVNFIWNNTLNVLEVLAPTENVYIGKGVIGAGNDIGQKNVYIGYEAGYESTLNTQNVFVGYFAGRSAYSNTSTGNTLVGYIAGYRMTTSQLNTCVGAYAGSGLTTGQGQNTLLGYNAGGSMTTGRFNISIGKDSGTTITTGVGNIFIGQNAEGYEADANYRISIGYNAVSRENQLCAIGGGSASYHLAIFGKREFRFYDGNAVTNYVGFEAPDLDADQIWVLPNADGDASDFLQTDGAGNLTWAAGGGGNGAITFVGLTDTPANYVGAANKIVKVNATPDALEFGADIEDLEDVDTIVGQAGKYAKVKAGDAGIEWSEAAAGGNGDGVAAGAILIFDSGFDDLALGDIDGKGTYDYWGTWVNSSGAGCTAEIVADPGGGQMLRLDDQSGANSAKATLTLTPAISAEVLVGVVEWKVRVSAFGAGSRGYFYIQDKDTAGTGQGGFFRGDSTDIYYRSAGNQTGWLVNAAVDTWYTVRTFFDRLGNYSVWWVDGAFEQPRVVVNAGDKFDELSFETRDTYSGNVFDIKYVKVWSLNEVADGVTTFLDLADTPSAYTLKRGYVPVVNDDEDALVFIHSKDLPPKKTIDDPPDDEFEAATLDGKWTVVDGASGTVDLIGTAGNIYDLASRRGHLLVQAINGQEFSIRQDYTLADGKSIILAVSAAVTCDGLSGVANNEIMIKLSLNDNDATHEAGNYVTLSIDTQTDGMRILYYKAPTYYGTSNTVNDLTHLGQKFYLRILRSGTTYYGFFSIDCETWVPLYKHVLGGALTNIWITVDSAATVGTPVPIQAFDWIRLGDDKVCPW